MTVRNLLVMGALALGITLLPACGGGGGGGEEEPCGPPGSLQAVAIQGQDAPVMGGGKYAAFASTVPLAAGDGGWVAFVANVVGGTVPQAAFVAPPGEPVLAALLVGDNAPGATSGTIASVQRVWISESGWLLALVTVAGGGPTQGLVSVRIAAGAVAESHGIVYDDEALDGTGLAGTLTSFRTASIHLTPEGHVFFGGSTAAGDGFWRSEPDATGLTLLVGSGDPLGGPASVDTLHATAVDATGTRFAFVADAAGAGAARGVFGGVVGAAGYATLIEEGDVLEADESVLTVPDVQNLLVYAAEDTSTGARYVGAYLQIIDDDGDTHILANSNAPGAQPRLIARAGDAAPGSSTGTITIADLGLLSSAPSTQAPTFWTELLGLPPSQDFALYAVLPGAAGPALAMIEGQLAPPGNIGNVTETFLGLAGPDRIDVSADGGAAVVNVPTSGRPVVIWLIAFCGQFAIVLSGNPTPDGGDVFVADNAWRQTTADDVVFVRASLQTQGSGLFRQAPD